MLFIYSFFLLLNLIVIPIQPIRAAEQNFVKNNPSLYLSQDVWEDVQNYLMPEDHPIKTKLDEIFLNSRAFMDEQSMKQAGFDAAKPESHTKIVVTRHPKLKGYVIKAYLDAITDPKGRPEHYYLIKRVQGARLVQASIIAHHYEHLFKVPRKWIYLLPDDPSPPSGYLRKRFILVEDDMYIVNAVKNEKRWKSKKVTPELLEALYTITTEISLSDSTKPSNCPFCKDGRLAFVDTQTFHTGYVKYDRLLPYLSLEMKAYWKELMSQ